MQILPVVGQATAAPLCLDSRAGSCCCRGVTTTLHLAELPDTCRALARNHVANLVDAASVMFDKFHQPPADGVIDFDSKTQPLLVSWDPPAPRLRETHANELDATEEGAYAVAFSAVMSHGFVVRRRVHHGSGADYLLSREGEPDNDFVKLEVSGVARGDKRLAARLETKIRQVAGGDLPRPGLAVVVGFQAVQVFARKSKGGS